MNSLSDSDVRKIAMLAQIAIKDEDLPHMKQQLQSTFDILNTLQSVDTSGVEPMSNPFDAIQRLREDVITESDHRDEYQKIAPAVENGLYVVPKVIE